MKKIIAVALLALAMPLFASDMRIRDVMREQGQVGWVLNKLVAAHGPKPFIAFTMNAPAVMNIDCAAPATCRVTFTGGPDVKSYAFEFERTGRHVGYFSRPGMDYDVRSGSAQSFMLSRLKPLRR